MKPLILFLLAVMVSCALLLTAIPAFAKKHKEAIAAIEDKPVYDHTGTMFNQTGVDKYDSEAHVTVNGETYDAYCNMSDTSVSCSDHVGYSYTFVALEGPKDPDYDNHATESRSLDEKIASAEQHLQDLQAQMAASKTTGLDLLKEQTADIKAALQLRQDISDFRIQKANADWVKKDYMVAGKMIVFGVVHIDGKRVGFPDKMDYDALNDLAQKLPDNHAAPFKYRLYEADTPLEFSDVSKGTPMFCVPFEITDKKGNSKQGESCYPVEPLMERERKAYEASRAQYQ